jgi:hypothetical protein
MEEDEITDQEVRGKEAIVIRSGRIVNIRTLCYKCNVLQ